TAIFVLRSTDMGRTWSNPVQASDPGTSEDKPWSTADGRYVYVTWTRFSGTPTQIRFARSTDGGQTWGNYTNLHTTGQTAQWSIPAVGRGDTVYVSWSLDDRNTSGWTVGWDPYVKISTDRGVTWGAEYPSPRANNYRASGTGGSFRWRHLPYSGFAVSKKTGHLHRAYTTRDSSTGVYRIRYTRSTDAGRTWSTPFRLNSTMTPDTFEAFFPWIAVDDSVGHIHVVWYDMRAGRPDSSLDVYYRRSTDGGTTWLPELRVTDVSFWPDTLPSGGFAAIIGDYINVATSTDFAVAGWCDCRNERQGRKEDVYVSRYGYLVDIKEGKKQALETDFILSPCRPNPSRGLVKIQFTNPVTADLSLKVFDLCGNVVRTLIEGTVKEGTNRVMWDGRDDNNVEVPQGVYFIRLKTDKATRIDKITIVK
ncbi:MAG: FlgD immunoglobulin-like domain containing protein, partial [candidate division WOR-3 bacterium]